jgi:SAM-dependent methyltransferase
LPSSWRFDLYYLLGQTPWDTQVTPPEVVDLIEGGRMPAGRALDLGCGTGTNCIYLARHGWEAVGVDFSATAIRRARRKARRAGVDCRFHQAGVTDLAFLANPFDLVLDIGCLHSVPLDRRSAYAEGVTRLTHLGGLYMLYAFTPRPGQTAIYGEKPVQAVQAQAFPLRISPTQSAGEIHGIAPDEVRNLFAPAFKVERREGGDDPTGPSSAWYWLRRKACP